MTQKMKSCAEGGARERVQICHAPPKVSHPGIAMFSYLEAA
jgi:hypothetical protein